MASESALVSHLLVLDNKQNGLARFQVLPATLQDETDLFVTAKLLTLSSSLFFFCLILV